MSSGKYSGFSDIAKQAMMQPQESMLEVKSKKNKLYIGIPKGGFLPGKPYSPNSLIRSAAGKQRPRSNAGKQCRQSRQTF
jgi:hypothetical protein